MGSLSWIDWLYWRVINHLPCLGCTPREGSGWCFLLPLIFDGEVGLPAKIHFVLKVLRRVARPCSCLRGFTFSIVALNQEMSCNDTYVEHKFCLVVPKHVCECQSMNLGRWSPMTHVITCVLGGGLPFAQWRGSRPRPCSTRSCFWRAGIWSTMAQCSGCSQMLPALAKVMMWSFNDIWGILKLGSP